MMRRNASDSSSPEQSADGQSQSGSGINEDDDDTAKLSPSTASLQPERNYGHEGPKHQQVPQILHPRPDVSITKAPQIEHVGHSIACGSSLYDLYYGGMMATYGQPLA